MTHQAKLTAVRQKIVEACPESEKKFELCCKCEYHNIDTSPHLEHVLRALYKFDKYHDIIIFTNGDICRISGDPRDELYINKKTNWDLNKDLSGQTEATIDFLSDVLYSK